MKKIITNIILLISVYGFACICPPILKLSEKQKSEIEYSECIFIGEVLEVDNKNLTFKIKVQESLDGGDKIGNIYLGKNWKGCDPYIEETGKWIIYGHMENGYLRTNMCGISRSFDNPFVNQIPFLPDNYEKLTEKEKIKLFDNSRVEIAKMAKTDLESEINTLRKIRDENKKASR